MADDKNGPTEPRGGAAEGAAELAEIAKAIRELVAELKEANVSLRAIARSQAQQATQKRPHNP